MVATWLHMIGGNDTNTGCKHRKCCKSILVSFLPCLVAFWGFHPYTHLLSCVPLSIRHFSSQLSPHGIFKFTFRCTLVWWLIVHNSRCGCNRNLAERRRVNCLYIQIYTLVWWLIAHNSRCGCNRNLAERRRVNCLHIQIYTIVRGRIKGAACDRIWHIHCAAATARSILLSQGCIFGKLFTTAAQRNGCFCHGIANAPQSSL